MSFKKRNVEWATGWNQQNHNKKKIKSMSYNFTEPIVQKS